MSVSIDYIVELYASMERNDGGRNASYDEAVRWYTGSDLKTTKKQGYFRGIAAAISSFFSPYKKDQDEDLEIRTPINIVRPAIDNKVAYLSMMPFIRVIEPPASLAPTAVGGEPGAPPTPPAGMPPEQPEPLPQETPSPEMPAWLPPEMAAELPAEAPAEAPVPPEDWGAIFADRLEKSIHSLLDASNIQRRVRDVAWSVAALDGAVIGVWPDLRHGRPKIFTRTPKDFYPVSYDDDGLELQMALWVDYMTGLEVAAQYGIKDYVDSDEVEVIFYMDEEKFCTVLNKEKWAHDPIDNVMGVVPIVCVGTLGVPGMIFGSTEMKDAIPAALAVNNHMALIDKMSNAMVEPTIFVTDPISVPDDLAIGKGGVATAGKDGSVTLLGPIQLPNAFWALGEILNNWFDLIADNPAVLRSDSGSAIITGKGFNAQLGPVAARMQIKLDLIMAAWKRVIKYMLLMWADFPGANARQKATGVKSKEYYYIEAEPSEFIVDGNIWTEIEVRVNVQSYIDKQSDRIGIMQLYQSELMDWDTAVDQIDEITDRARVRKNIDRDRQWKAEGMMILQGLAQSAATANTNPGEQEKINYAMERGLLGETPPMPQPTATGETAEMGGMELAPPNEGLLATIEEFFSGIANLRGEAWWGGQILTDPNAFMSDNWTVTVWVTDGQDQGTITRAAAKVPEIYGHIKFIQGRPGPEENAHKFSEGAGVQPGPTPPSTGTPELDALMGGEV